MSQHLTQHRRAILALTSLAAGSALVAGAIVGLPTAGAQQGQLEVVSGNPTCAGLGFPNGFKIEATGELVPAGAYTVGDPGTETEGNAAGFTVTITYASEDPVSLGFTANRPVSAAVVKAGPGAHVYRYNPPVASDSGLQSPTEDSVSYLAFCWNGSVGEEPTTTTTTVDETTTTTVDGTTTTDETTTTTTDDDTTTTTTKPGKTTTTQPSAGTTKPGAGTTTPGQRPQPGTAQPASPVPGSPDFTG